jgi:hypothetical protein
MDCVAWAGASSPEIPMVAAREAHLLCCVPVCYSNLKASEGQCGV